MAGSRGNRTVASSLPPPRPKSPPEYPDLYGKRRELARVQMLEREIGFLEEELKSVEGLQPASKSCKELADFVTGNVDPLIPTTTKTRKPCRFWKWLCGSSCFNLSWLCCCSCPNCLEKPCCPDCNICNCSGSCMSCRMPKCSCFSCPSSNCCKKSTCCCCPSCCTPNCSSCPTCSSCTNCTCNPRCPKLNSCSCCCKNCCCCCCRPCYFCC